MNKLILPITLLLLSGCTKTVYVDENRKEVVPVEKSIPDYTNSVKEVCINGVVYYRLKSGESYAALTPKIHKAVVGNRLRLSEC